MLTPNIKRINNLLIASTLFIYSMIGHAMEIEKPAYYLKLNMHACPRLIDVNGVEIERDFTRANSAAEYPLNPWIRNGKNSITVHILAQAFTETITYENSRCNASIWLRGRIDSKAIDVKVADIDFTPNYEIPTLDRIAKSSPEGKYKLSESGLVQDKDTGDISISEVRVEQHKLQEGVDSYTRNFTAKVPFPEWAFFSGDKLYDYYPMSNEKYIDFKSQTWPLVEEIWDLFEEGDIKKILPLFELRSKEYDLAFYREPGYSLESLKSSLELVYKEDFPLNRKDEDQMQLVVSYNEKLFTIVNAATLNGTVMFYDEQDNTNTFYDMMWMKKDGKWIIAR